MVVGTEMTSVQLRAKIYLKNVQYNTIKLLLLNIIQSPAVCIRAIVLPVLIAGSSTDGCSEWCNPAHFPTVVLTLYLK